MKETTYHYALTSPQAPEVKGTRKIQPPTVHIARGFEERLPFLKHRHLICLSDWQYETETQEDFWRQTLTILEAELGDDFRNALVLVAGDMASKANHLLGSASDAPPRLRWLYETFAGSGDVFMIYGNHDDMLEEHLTQRNTGQTNLPCLLPQGQPVQVTAAPGVPDTGAHTKATTNQRPKSAASKTRQKGKKQTKKKRSIPTTQEERQWERDNPDQVALRTMFQERDNSPLSRPAAHDQKSPTTVTTVAGVHGIPSTYTQGMKKIARANYFHSLETACRHQSQSPPIDILVTHSNPKLPGQHGRTIQGATTSGDDDALRITKHFQESSALLHVYGHMHFDPAVLVLADSGKVAVNCDCRVVVFVAGG